MNRPVRVFGIDGGGTTTRLRVADGGNACVFEAEGRAINPHSVPRSEAEARLAELFLRAQRETGIPPGGYDAGCAGVAGADRPGERAWLESLFRDRLGMGCPLVLTADADIALAGAHGIAGGLLLVAGTGSVALARLPGGERFKAGGFGHFLGDEGSAFWIAFRAIARSMRSAEGRDLPSSLPSALPGHFGLRDLQDFIPLVYGRFDKAAIAAAAGLVEFWRERGDPLAEAIFDDAARELAQLVLCLRPRVEGMLDGPRLALRGGVFEHNRQLRESVSRAITDAWPGLRIADSGESPASGACILAMHAFADGARGPEPRRMQRPADGYGKEEA